MQPPPLPEGEDETFTLSCFKFTEHDKTGEQMLKLLTPYRRYFSSDEHRALDSSMDLKTLVSQYPFVQTEQVYNVVNFLLNFQF